MNEANQNTDRELWREPPGDCYANSIHVTDGGGIGINVGGTVVVRPLAEWHKALTTIEARDREIAELKAKKSMILRHFERMETVEAETFQENKSHLALIGRLVEALVQIAGTFKSLEKTYNGGLWTTGAGYSLQPDYLKIKELLDSPEVKAALTCTCGALEFHHPNCPQAALERIPK